MLELDGTDGGGQLVRTALSLSVVDGQPFRMENVRANRPNPGLKRQHLACVELLASLVDADVDGAEKGAETLTFDPGTDADEAITPDTDDFEGETLQSGRSGPTVSAMDDDLPEPIAVDVGTAGSVTLIADTVLPLAGRLAAPIRLRLGGGTDVKWSPSTDYLRHVKLPLLRTCGLEATVSVNRRGFYPAGGGELALDIRPSTLSPILLPERPTTVAGGRPAVSRLSARAVATRDLEDSDVADRMAETALSLLSERERFDETTQNATARYVESDSTGAVITLVGEGDAGRPSEMAAKDDAFRARPRAGFVAHGERGVPAEDVAAEAVDAAAAWHRTDAPVDEHLGDQLVVWLALAGGESKIPRVTDHVRTNVALVRSFGYDVAIQDRSGDGPATLSAPR
ncbi:RNA 3'-terminal phosphate cyclase [Halobellus marinus]|uniref:RNA 3'-terminal phosphate cyclase n=1 Tax=Halobellus TaxID=1073986 RepID=UPI0028AF174D|nr:RNA 3'-terminal phosphate cyclase [Halobellus sp. DFY28]